MLVALFALSIFSQEIYGEQEPVLSLIADTGSDYAFIAGAVLGVLAFIYYKIAREKPDVNDAEPSLPPPPSSENQLSVVYCSHCGCLNDANSAFCPHCGNRIRQAEMPG